jgi:hypothetical protein
MRTHRKITPIIVLAAGLSAGAPISAPASTLLSGYGGPGQGTQAILGGTLLNGPSGGGGSSGSPPTATAPLGTVGTGGSGAGTSRSAGGAHRHAGARAGTQAAVPGPSGGSYRSYPRLGASRTSAGPGVLGLSDSAFLFALLALAALLFTGLLTRGLAKASGTRWHAGS